MGKIYVGQTDLVIKLDVRTSIPSVSQALIKYKKPDGTLGQFNASVDDETYGVISYSVSGSTDIDQAGEWVFWAHITFTNGKVIAGEPSCLTVYEEGN